MVYQPPVRYPTWFSTLDRARIDDALVTHDAPIADDVSRDVVIIRREYASRAAAEHAVRAVFQVIVQVLDRHLEYRSVKTLRTEAHRMLGDVIAWAEASLPSTGNVRPQLDDATTMMGAAREGPSWLTLMVTGSSPVVTTTAPRSRPRQTRDVSRLHAERERIVLPLLDEVDWKPSRWAKEAGIDPHVVLRYLAGTSTPGKLSRSRLTYVLAKALNNRKLRLPE